MTSPQPPTTGPDQPVRPFHVVVVGGVGVAFVMGALFFSDSCGATPSRTGGTLIVETVSPKPPAPQQAVAPPTDPDAPPPDTDPYRYFDPKKAMARMRFGDVNDGTTNSDAGAVDLAGWSAQRLPWSYVSGPAETTVGKALKDIDKERGKRGCWSGFVGEITAAGGMYRGGLVLNDMKVLRFYAVHDTGNIVQDSTARFCGIVTGLITFTNAAQTTTQAVQVVGMFDLPTNHTVDLDTPVEIDWTKKVAKESL